METERRGAEAVKKAAAEAANQVLGIWIYMDKRLRGLGRYVVHIWRLFQVISKIGS